MKREMITTAATCKMVELDGFANDPIRWLSQRMQIHKLNYLLAHADDGVIWGRLDDERLNTSHDAAPEHAPPLCTETLQTARIFGPDGELLIWRDEMGAWTARLISETTPDTSPKWTQAFKEHQILWGTKTQLLARNFALLSEGSQGLLHVIPLPVDGNIDERHRPLRLVVHHYVKVDENGFMRVDASRLFDLLLLTEPKESAL